MFGLIKKQEENQQRRDLMIVLQEDGAADIATVMEIDDDRILATGAEGTYSIPLGDAKRYIGQRGKVFLYPSTIENIADTKRIAKLEISKVLEKITHFEKEQRVLEDVPKLPIGRMIMIGGIVLLIIIIMMVSK